MHEPERLGLDVLADGLRATPEARAANYVEAVGARDGAVILRDRETGTEFGMRARVVVNASGPWTDLTNGTLGESSALMGGTKGSHIVLDHPELFAACDDRELFFENGDGRIVLIHPLKGRVMVGTTDLDADPREPALCTEDEVDYFFDLVSHVFPTIVVDRSQIVYRFAGIRPLPRHDDTQPGFVSRDYRVVPGRIDTLPGTELLSLVGGKWTTFRALGERLADDVLALLGRQRTVVDGQPRDRRRGRIPPHRQERAAWVEQHRGTATPARAEQLLERYGTRAAEVLDGIDPAKDRPLENDPEFSTGELRHIAAQESVVHLIDVVLRRTNHAFTGAISPQLLAEFSELTARP